MVKYTVISVFCNFTVMFEWFVKYTSDYGVSNGNAVRNKENIIILSYNNRTTMDRF